MNGKTTQTDILAMLPPERRKEIIQEALGSQMRQLVEKHKTSPIAVLFEALRAHPSWHTMKEIPLAIALAMEPAPAPQVRRGRPPGSGKGKGRPRASVSDKQLDALVAFVKKHPGLRSEEIQRKAGITPPVVRAGLEKLRDAKRVKTKGKLRASKYYLAT